MNLWLRFIRIFIHAFFRERLKPLQDSKVCFRIYPHDLDYNRHMTNSRYHSLSDLARIDGLIRSGLGKFLVKNGYGTVLGSSYIRFRRGLKLFQKLDLRTRFVGYDDKWFYMEHHFESGDQLIACSIVKATFTKGGKSMRTEDVFKQFIPDHEYKKYATVPSYIHDWIQMEIDLKTALSKEYNNES
ncbi:MAG: thioesterase family protein [Candidatus Nucleicultricaceae bacterium]